MKLEEVCIQLCQGAVSAWCTDKPCIVDSVPDHMVVVAFQKIAAFIPVVVQKPHIPVANDQNSHLRQALPSDVLVVLALGRQHAQRPVHREQSTGKWCIHHAVPHAHLLIFWREADHFTGAGEELHDNHVCIGVKGGRFNSQQLAILHF